VYPLSLAEEKKIFPLLQGALQKLSFPQSQ